MPNRQERRGIWLYTRITLFNTNGRLMDKMPLRNVRDELSYFTCKKQYSDSADHPRTWADVHTRMAEEGG